MSDNRIIECMERAQYLLGNLMAVKPGEEVLIVVDFSIFADLCNCNFRKTFLL